MSTRRDIWNFLIVTAVTALIWYYAAGETRVSEDLTVRLRIVVPVPENWTMARELWPVTVEAEGSSRAIRDAASLLSEISLPVTPLAGRRVIDVVDQLRLHPAVQESGIAVIAASPATIELDMDELVDVTATVVAQLPGAETTDEMVEPAQVKLRMPSRMRQLSGDSITVNAIPTPQALARLAPGVRHTIENVPLDRTEGVLAESSVRVQPDRVRVTFTVKAQVGELTLAQPVRVQVAGPPEDTEFTVEVEPRQYRDVTVAARLELIEKIRAGNAVVVAIVHLKSSEKEQRIERKRVTYFAALLPDGSAELVQLRRVGETTAWPEVALTIERAPEP